jgi:hypothetical protein
VCLRRPLQASAGPSSYSSAVQVPQTLAVLAIAYVLASSSANLADRRVPSTPMLALQFPMSTDSVVSTLQMAMTAAGVPSGFEQAPPTSDARPAAQSPSASLMRLNGRSVREILTDFITFDPRYTWQEADGRILVRPAAAQGANGFLQTRLPTIELDARRFPLRWPISLRSL